MNKQQDRAIERAADRLVRQEHALVESSMTRHQQLRETLLNADQSHVVPTDVGKDLPSPEVSLRLLEYLSNRSRTMAGLSIRMTVDETFGCWALPLNAEYTPAGISKYPLLTSKHLGMVSVIAHRFMWRTLIDNDIPPTVFLDHLCRVHACCNITHLEAVTPRENTLRGNLARRVESGQEPLFRY